MNGHRWAREKEASFSEDQQKLLWSEQSASISRLHKRLDAIERDIGNLKSKVEEWWHEHDREEGAGP